MTAEEQVARKMCEILARKHPGTVWRPLAGEDPAPGVVVVRLAGREDIEATKGDR